MTDWIQNILDRVPRRARIVGGVVVAGITLVAVARRYRQKPKRPPHPRDVVILHQVGRSSYAPSMVPFIVKLETFFRMAKVPYQNVHDRKRSSKGKFPWIEYNGEEIADSSFCVKFVNKTFDVDLNKGLNDTERACAHAVQRTIEENTYWTFALHRWVFDKEEKLMKYVKMPRLMLYFVRSDLKKGAYGHGIGRHTEEEVYTLMEEDLRALSDFIGDKKFLMGDNPCEEDAAVFGQLSQFYWMSYGNRAEKMFKKYENLCRYCDRMKEAFWPDWEECHSHGGTRKPTK